MKHIYAKDYKNKTFTPVMIDDEDYDLDQFNWSINPKDGYVYGRIPEKGQVRLHRLITNALPGEEVDHKDGNKLNNVKSNLRRCTKAQNMCNSKKYSTNKSGYKGVSFHKRSNKWQSTIMKNQKKIYIGVFDNPVEAAKAYDTKAIELFGEFAKTNQDLGLL